MLNRRISLKRFKRLIMEAVKNKPSNIRYGQCVFNFIDENFHVARQIQMEDNIDCFYDDSQVPLFIINARRPLPLGRGRIAGPSSWFEGLHFLFVIFFINILVFFLTFQTIYR